jgi:hypothetical protein
MVLLKNFFERIEKKHREGMVEEVAQNLIDTLLKAKLDGSELSPLEIAWILNKVNPAVETELELRKQQLEKELQETVLALSSIAQN